MSEVEFLRVITFMLENGIITFEQFNDLYQNSQPYLE